MLSKLKEGSTGKEKEVHLNQRIFEYASVINALK